MMRVQRDNFRPNYHRAWKILGIYIYTVLPWPLWLNKFQIWFDCIAKVSSSCTKLKKGFIRKWNAFYTNRSIILLLVCDSIVFFPRYSAGADDAASSSMYIPLYISLRLKRKNKSFPMQNFFFLFTRKNKKKKRTRYELSSSFVTVDFSWHIIQYFFPPPWPKKKKCLSICYAKSWIRDASIIILPFFFLD